MEEIKEASFSSKNVKVFMKIENPEEIFALFEDSVKDIEKEQESK